MIQISLPDGSIKQVEKGISAAELAARIHRKLGKDALAAKINGVLCDLGTPLTENASVEIVTFESEEGAEVYRHSTSHLMAQAVKSLFPDTKVAIGPAVDDGFYYDFDTTQTFTPEDLRKIEQKMLELIQADLPYVRKEVSRGEAIDFFQRNGEDYKVEILNALPEGERITQYQQGDFVDLCRGPHVPSTGKIKAFKLLSIAGAYWRGDEKRQMLQRIYGTSFPSKKELTKHLDRLEEAKRRDHRKLGKKLDLFSIHQEAGAGLIYWHPKGAVLRRVIEDFWKDVHVERGYELVTIPHIAHSDLWRTSGHYNFYRENMYTLGIDEEEYVLKPMNCPGHILIYNNTLRSYRELPVRYAELGTVYRYERSGTLHGMLRVRGFTQDDAHIFCTPEQLFDELVGVLDLTEFMLKSFGFHDYNVELSVRDPQHPEKYAGSDENWELAEQTLVRALEHKGLSYKRMEGEAVFYGPKIDTKLIDALGRGWQGPTTQFDFNLPSRFDVNYVGKDGEKHHVYMVHRTVLGSMERFVGALIEHYAGAFPLWLAPVQLKILPIGERHIEYAKTVQAALRHAKYRVEIDMRDEKIGQKIRVAQLEQLPYMLIIGDKEVSGQTVSLRHRRKGDLGSLTIDQLLHQLSDEVQ
ncbi:threonine--tRNA ligase [candidate division KSB3 bacterium]|uniref:Threonine--tRNA ligase n=1 Tax=candidate division KSB3 bacterium TaxID=2044937 RepID=A0A2G6EAC5_9BACT|nr:MAG: threonine--tRNA ligase [candidate division KSB3 bacterium]PIE30796.1 MAG: threonine--tRNA ligase [candidate division KSB3 bacterium]